MSEVVAERVELIVAGQRRELQVKELQGQRVVTLREVDELHNRPEGTARRNFNVNRDRLIDGQDYFVRNSSEAQSEFGIMAPNGLVLLTESGYLMLVKSFTDDLAWEVQRQLVNAYFRVKDVAKPMSIEDIIIAQAQALKEARLQAEAAKTEAASAVALAERAHHRIDSLDTISIEGNLRQRFEKMIRRYAYENGIYHSVAWHHFDAAYNNAYHANLTALRQNYCAKHGLREVSRPDYFDRIGRLEDAIRVADKMLNT